MCHNRLNSISVCSLFLPFAALCFGRGCFVVFASGFDSFVRRRICGRESVIYMFASSRVAALR